MAWLSRNDFTPSDYVHAYDLNNLANDIRTWGGNVNGGGYTLSNVVLEGISISSPVASVFGRTGAVVAQAGDYTAAQITGAVSSAVQVIAGPGLTGGGALTGNVTLNAAVTSVFGRVGAVTLTPTDISGAMGVTQSRRINTGTGLTGGGTLAADLTLSVVPDSVNQQVQILNAGVSIGTRHALNFVSGANVSLSISDNSANNRVDITVASTGGSGGMVDPTTTTGDLIVRGPSVPNRLGVGTDGTVLTADSTQPLGVRWGTGGGGGGAVSSVFSRTGAVVAMSGDYTAAQVLNAVSTATTYSDPAWITGLSWTKILNPPTILLDPTTTKGDLLVRGTSLSRLPVAADGSILMADSTQSLGVRWSGSSVLSVFGRTGAVIGQAGDYTVSQITGAVPNTVQVIAGTGLTGGGPLNGNVTLNVSPQSMVQLINAYQGGLLIGTMPGINFIAGTNVSLSVVKNTANNWTDVTINSAGTGGGSGQNQTPWLQDINAAGFSLNNTSGIGVNMVAGAAPLMVTTIASAPDATIITTPNNSSSLMGIAFRGGSVEAGFLLAPTSFSNAPFVNLASIYSTQDIAFLKAASPNDSTAVEHVRFTATGRVGIAKSSPGYALDITGDCNISGAYRVNGVPIGTGGQTPWTSDINGGGFGLSNTRYVAIGSASLPASPAIGLAIQGSSGLTTATVNETSSSGSGGLIIKNDASQSTVYMLGSAGSPASALALSNASSSGPITFSANAAERMRITSTGNVGIGNTFPAAPDADSAIHLLVGSTTSAPFGEISVCANQSASGYNVGAINFCNYNLTGADKRIACIVSSTDGAANSGNFIFYTWSAGVSGERMRITNAGNVGIGTGAPHAILHTVASPTYEPSLTMDTACGAILTCNWGQLAFGNSANSPYPNWLQCRNSGNAALPLALNPLGGNVGIGTMGPHAILHTVASPTYEPSLTMDTACGAILTCNWGQFAFGNSANSPYPNWLQCRNAGNAALPLALNPLGGNVGIGTMSPGYTLDVNGDINTHGVFRVSGTPISGGPATVNSYSASTRPLNTSFTNSTGKPLYALVTVSLNATVVVNGTNVAEPTSSGNVAVFFIVMPGYPYQVNSTGTWQQWFEWY